MGKVFLFGHPLLLLLPSVTISYEIRIIEINRTSAYGYLCHLRT